MRSHRTPWKWLLAKEFRELSKSRAWWVFLLLTGPLVGVSFVNAVRTYAEASGLGGTSVGVGEAFSPLVGIWAPTFSAYEIAAVFLLPFVAIRMMAGDRQSGALKLELQQRISSFKRVLTKAAVLMVGWTCAVGASVVAIVLWLIYGGSAYAPEIAAVSAGHLLNALLTIAFAAAASSMTEHPSTAAILTFAFTVGTWVLDFVGAIQGGIWESLAGYIPTAMIAQFQHGLIRMDVVFTAVAFVLSGLGLASIWLRLGVPVRQRVFESVFVGLLTTCAVVGSSWINLSWDFSENRQNSFSEGDEAILQRIKSPLRIEAHLAPKDPRRTDLERRAFSKLRRVMNDVRVDYISSTSIGLFEQTADHYGEIWYDLGGQKTMSRATTEEGVLETIFALSKVNSAGENEKSVFTGHPLAVQPAGAGVIFYGIWPAVIGTAAYLTLRRNNR